MERCSENKYKKYIKFYNMKVGLLIQNTNCKKIETLY